MLIDKHFKKINNINKCDEIEHVKSLLKIYEENLSFSDGEEPVVKEKATTIISNMRKSASSGLDALLQTYNLSNEEGLALMRLAEGLLRIPDKEVAERLIEEKLTGKDWNKHIQSSKGFLLPVATAGLSISSKILDDSNNSQPVVKVLNKLLKKLSKPVIKKAVYHAMQVISSNFIYSPTIDGVLKKIPKEKKKGFLYSFDMLGEAALTLDDADKYYDSYYNAIDSIGKCSDVNVSIENKHGISVKLSALDPCYSWEKEELVLERMYPRLLVLCQLAAKHNIGLCIDAEESYHLYISLLLIEKLCLEPSLKDWHGLGLAIQAYQKCSLEIINYVIELAKKTKKILMPRLVKGAYWDSEIAHYQEIGDDSYPVFTIKSHTDLSYLIGADMLIKATDYCYPCFASHNAYTISYIKERYKKYADKFEMQCLHGVAPGLRDSIIELYKNNTNIRIYAPVGQYKMLLPYLIRRMLENGANSSFLNQLVSSDVEIDDIVSNPVSTVHKTLDNENNPIKLPVNIFTQYQNSLGMNLSNTQIQKELLNDMEKVYEKELYAHPFNQ